MAFFDDLGKKISSSGQEVFQKGKNLVNTSQINSKISDEEKKLSSTYSQLGTKYFELYAQHPHEGLKELVDSINESIEAIANYSEQVNSLKGLVSCTSCGTLSSGESAFCSKCGTKLPELVKFDPKTSEPDFIVCPSCGRDTNAELGFCTFCNLNLKESAEEPSENMNASLKICRECSALLPDDSAICTECGTDNE